MIRAAIFALILTPAGAGIALAHGGALNAEGCHTNRKTGDYHCHRDGGRASADSGRVNFLADPAPRGTSAPAGGFRNCAAARAAGAAPVRIGEPGYAPRLDRDGDGVGCE